MLHAGQFAILKTRITLPGYQHIELGNGWILSYHEELPVFCDAEKQILLLGLAWQALPGRGTPAEEISKLKPIITEQQLLRMEETWCGRYVLIHKTNIYLDAHGVRSVFYSETGACSDCLLMGKAMGLEERLYYPLEHLNWMPAPRTHYSEIRRLMPGQVLDYATGGIHTRPLLATGYEHFTDEQQLIEQFSDVFCHSLRQMTRLFPERKWLIALTGGYDSRTLFALAKRAGMDFETYTFEHDTIYEGDVEIPKQLAAKAGVPHFYGTRDPEAYSRQREDEYNRQTAGLVRDEDRLFYAFNQYQELIERYGDVVILRSSIWATVIEDFSRYFDRTAGYAPVKNFYQEFEIPEGSMEHETLEEYFRWCGEHPTPGVNLANRFYWEQRDGCWLSSFEQGFDAVEHIISLQPVNCRWMISMLMDFPEEERLIRRHQTRIAEYACPEIAGTPYTDTRRLGESRLASAGDKLARGIHRLRHMGLKNTWDLYKKILKERRTTRAMHKEWLEDYQNEEHE